VDITGQEQMLIPMIITVTRVLATVMVMAITSHTTLTQAIVIVQDITHHHIMIMIIRMVKVITLGIKI